MTGVQLPDHASCKRSAGKERHPKCMLLAIAVHHCTSPAGVKTAVCTQKYYCIIVLVSPQNFERSFRGMDRACARKKKCRDLNLQPQETFFFPDYKLSKNVDRLNSVITSAKVIVFSYYDNDTTAKR